MPFHRVPFDRAFRPFRHGGGRRRRPPVLSGAGLSWQRRHLVDAVDGRVPRLADGRPVLRVGRVPFAGRRRRVP